MAQPKVTAEYPPLDLKKKKKKEKTSREKGAEADWYSLPNTSATQKLFLHETKCVFFWFH